LKLKERGERYKEESVRVSSDRNRGGVGKKKEKSEARIHDSKKRIDI